MVLAGSKTTTIDSFKITNSGTIDGKLKFVADTSDFNYSLTEEPNGVITATTLELQNASLTLTNSYLPTAVSITEILITATTKTCLSTSLVTIGSLKNAALGEVNLTNSKITKLLENPQGGTVTFTSIAFIQEITNSGVIFAQQGLFAFEQAKFTNSQAGSITIAGAKATFSGVATNTGRLTAKAGLSLESDAKFTNEGTLAVTGGFSIASKSEFKLKSGTLTFTEINNQGIFSTAKKENFTIANNNIFTNSGTLTVAGKLINRGSLTLAENSVNKLGCYEGSGTLFFGLSNNNINTVVATVTGAATFTNGAKIAFRALTQGKRIKIIYTL